MKYFTLFLFFILLGCVYSPKPQKYFIQSPIDEVETKAVLIEINSVPAPFNLGGDDPYVVWMNGRKVDLPKKDLVELVNKVGLQNIPDIDPVDIHKGWLWPHHAKREEFPKNISRTRQLKTRVQ
jgi:hypothetical protein